jgi:hypothetical protein
MSEELETSNLPTTGVSRKIIENAFIEAAALEAAEFVLSSGQFKGKEFCQKIWTAQKQILKDKYKIDWDFPIKDIKGNEYFR